MAFMALQRDRFTRGEVKRLQKPENLCGVGFLFSPQELKVLYQIEQVSRAVKIVPKRQEGADLTFSVDDRQDFGKDPVRSPGDALEEALNRLPQTDQVEPPVDTGSEHDAIVLQPAKGLPEDEKGEGRRIRPDGHDMLVSLFPGLMKCAFDPLSQIVSLLIETPKAYFGLDFLKKRVFG